MMNPNSGGISGMVERNKKYWERRHVDADARDCCQLSTKREHLENTKGSVQTSAIFQEHAQYKSVSR
jgi:hypothetical protein